MNNPKQNFFLTNNNQKIHYKFINNKSQTTIIFLHGLMSNIQSKKAKYLKNFSNKNKVNLLLFVKKKFCFGLFIFKSIAY